MSFRRMERITTGSQRRKNTDMVTSLIPSGQAKPAGGAVMDLHLIMQQQREITASAEDISAAVR